MHDSNEQQGLHNLGAFRDTAELNLKDFRAIAVDFRCIVVDFRGIVVDFRRIAADFCGAAVDFVNANHTDRCRHLSNICKTMQTAKDIPQQMVQLLVKQIYFDTFEVSTEVSKP